MTRTALIVWGGWSGHDPDLCSSMIRGWLKREGFNVRVETATSVVERGLRVERPLQPHPAGTDAILQLHGPQSAEAFGQATQPRHQLGIEITAEVSRDLVPVAPQCRNKFASRGHPVTVDD